MPSPVVRASEPAAAEPVAPAGTVPPANPAAAAATKGVPLRVAEGETSASAPVPRAVWDLCGIGRLPASPGTTVYDELPPHLGAIAVAEAREKLLAALRRGDARARVAAASLGTLSDGLDDAVARTALQRAGRDAVAVRWAGGRCLSDECRREAAERWAQLEPGNGVPQLLRMTGAPPRDEESLRALWAAQRFQVHWGVLAETVRKAMPPDVPPYLQPDLLIQAMNVDAALLDQGFRTATALCQPAPPAGSERQRGCTDLGRVMNERGDTLIAAMVGVRLREFGGLDPAEAEARRKTLRELQASSSLPFDAEQPMSCESARRTQRWIEGLARDGEVGALRAAAAASSPYSSTPPQFR